MSNTNDTEKANRLYRRKYLFTGYLNKMVPILSVIGSFIDLRRYKCGNIAMQQFEIIILVLKEIKSNYDH
ncbi:MAG: hypothetical protein DBX37_07575 [Massilioclostridium sp.]|nr:MAG: hypothetical protein DBX37_07575 [Massilioclostridium sp.]